MHFFLILGFLSTGDKRATGNWGLLDQLTALTWVKENIEDFGGDPNSITLFGEDSGAASITLLALSRLSKGLFHRVIALSGNALCGQYIQENPQIAAIELSRRLDCTVVGNQISIDCIRKVSFQEIIEKSNDMFVSTEI